MSTHAIGILAGTLAALRQHGMSRARIDALCAGIGPLADDGRQALKDALQ